ncbi:cytochrome P450-like protein [Tribolium castaneum]|uniref:Cytochrome P450-like protein n=1 Tax=Tribolium castaneum TaxID=7070 RepID=D6WJH9_TRICA|nr:PREDICTED: probable cytochrome P450 4d14 [Tribolium castaneum]EFA04629.1 cytochrome P450-like protein [Tribolium castaneum]|eukprot:XP_972577.1 PREDICTED: probable cytochrome P450 4d14 [Tribolium castaneum]
MYLIAIVIVLISLYLIVKPVKKTGNIDDFPEPPSKVFFGHALDAKSTTEILNVTTNYVKKYGKIVKLRLGPFFKALVVTDYKLVEFFLSSNSLLTKSQNYAFARSWLGNGLILANGTHWKQHRKILTPAFHLEILREYLETFDSVGRIFIEKLKSLDNVQSVDLDALVPLCTLDVICETAMGTKINAQKGENSEYVSSVKEMCRIIVARFLSPLKILKCTYWMTHDFYTERKVVNILHSFTSKVIDGRKTNRNETEKSGKKKAFLDLLLKFSDIEKLSDRDIREEVDTFMFAGHDTTATGVCFALYLLANNPEVQEKVLSEQKELFGDEKNPCVTYQELQNMKYLEYVIKETLRLYPSVPVIGRYLKEDTTFGDRVISAKTNVAIFIYGIHRNPDYFPEPEKFIPERFENMTNLPPYAYIPFSAGPRNCIGQKFAMLEMKSLISKVIRHFELTPANPHHELVLAAETVLKSANGIKIGLRARSENKM